MPKHVFKIENGLFGLTMTEPTPAITDPCTAVSTGFTAFTCQVTDGAINASPNVTTETVPATWCDPEETVQNVGATSFTLDLTFLQDPDLVAGLSRFLFENDTAEAWFYLGLDGTDPPKAVGKCRVVAGTIGGPGRTTLTATVSLPITGKPMICFGNATDSEPVTLTAETAPAPAAAVSSSSSSPSVSSSE